MRRLALLVVSSALAAGASACAPLPLDDELREEVWRVALGAGTFEPVTGFGDNPGGLAMYRYVPPGTPELAPLVVALHGCTQTATVYRAAGWEELADELGFYVLYPEQTSANNPAQCFNWGGDYGMVCNLEVSPLE